MLDDIELALVTLILLIWHDILNQQYWILHEKRKYFRRWWWIRLVNRKENTKGFYVNLVQELKQTDHEEFFFFISDVAGTFQYFSKYSVAFLNKKEHSNATSNWTTACCHINVSNKENKDIFYFLKYKY